MVDQFLYIIQPNHSHGYCLDGKSSSETHKIKLNDSGNRKKHLLGDWPTTPPTHIRGSSPVLSRGCWHTSCLLCQTFTIGFWCKLDFRFSTRSVWSHTQMKIHPVVLPTSSWEKNNPWSNRHELHMMSIYRKYKILPDLWRGNYHLQTCWGMHFQIQPFP